MMPTFVVKSDQLFCCQGKAAPPLTPASLCLCGRGHSLDFSKDTDSLQTASALRLSLESSDRN